MKRVVVMAARAMTTRVAGSNGDGDNVGDGDRDKAGG